MNKLTKSLLLAFTVTFMLPSTVSAATPPDFPTCSNPNSPVRVSHEEGTHGIAGDPSQYQGSDTVYNLDEDGNVYQCFCSVDGQGIQTNWWKVSSLTQDEIDELLADNWIFIVNGIDWGLENAPYLAKNSEYACEGGGNVAGTSSSSNNGNNNNNTGNTTNGGQILSSTASTSTGGSVLGLASTGNIITIYTYFAFGTISLLIGRLLKKYFN
jgi:hypothetical protein